MAKTEKFTGRAEIYKKHRPGYPKEFIDYMAKYSSLGSQSVVADIGSGTGILSRQLLERGYRVIGVEPNNDMRSTAEAELHDYPGFSSVNGTAEHTGLEDKSVDLVTVAQAFHWFDTAMFKAECKRILKQGANAALVWNSRDESSVFVKENAEIMKRFCPLFNGFSGGIGETPSVFEEFFENGLYEYRVYRNDLQYDIDGFIGRTLSASYAPKEGSPEYIGFVAALMNLFEKYSKDGKVTMPNITQSYIGKV